MDNGKDIRNGALAYFRKANDAGGYNVGFSPSNHNGSSYVELAVISKGQQFKH